jgi:hypothetical protein
MRWLGDNLEEKHEPRGVSVAEAQNGDSMKSSGRNLTLAAIEKQSLVLLNVSGAAAPSNQSSPNRGWSALGQEAVIRFPVIK